MGEQKADKTLKPQIPGEPQIPTLIPPFVACHLRDWIKYNLSIYTYKNTQLSEKKTNDYNPLIGIGTNNQTVERWSCLVFPLSKIGRQTKFVFHHLLSDP